MSNVTLRTLGALALMATPPLVTTAWLWISRTNGWRYDADLLVLFMGLSVGLCGVAILPASRWKRVVMVVLYLIGMSLLMILWSFTYVCAAFGACL